MNPTSAALEIGDRTTLRISAESIREQENREAVALQALNDFRELQSTPDSDQIENRPEPEWIDYFWRLAGGMTSEGRQALWGRILARAATGSIISARTLALLSTLSGEEARRLENLARFVVHNPGATWLAVGLLTHFSSRNASDEIEKLNLRIEELLPRRDQKLFGSIGILVESGVIGSFCQVPKGSELSIVLANEPFKIKLSSPSNAIGTRDCSPSGPMAQN